MSDFSDFISDVKNEVDEAHERMSAEVVELGMITKLDLDPDRVLNAAIGKMDCVVIIGYDKDGEEYFGASSADSSIVNWHLDRAKYKLLNIVDEIAGDGGTAG